MKIEGVSSFYASDPNSCLNMCLIAWIVQMNNYFPPGQMSQVNSFNDLILRYWERIFPPIMLTLSPLLLSPLTTVAEPPLPTPNFLQAVVHVEVTRKIQTLGYILELS